MDDLPLQVREVDDIEIDAQGMVQAPTAPGLGTRLQDAVRTRPDAVLRESAA